MTVPWLGLLLTLLTVAACLGSAAAEPVRRDVTNSDLRDLIVSLAHLVRAGEDKLERHEFRERQLGETLKRSLMLLEKKHRNLEPLKGILGRLDERLASVETILIQQDERERIQMQKTLNAVENLQSYIEARLSNVESLLVPKETTAPTTPPVSDSVSKEHAAAVRNLSLQVGSVLQKVEKLENELGKVQNESRDIKQINEKSAKKLEDVGKTIQGNEQLLSKYENRLAELSNSIQPIDTRFAPKQEADWESEFLSALHAQRSNLDQVQQEVKSISARIQQLPELKDLEGNSNRTFETLQEMKYELASKADKDSVKLGMKMNDMQQTLVQNHDELTKSFTDLEVMTENVYGDVTKSYEILRGEVQALSKVEKVMIQTADNVLDTRKRIEYGVHQILHEVGDAVKNNFKDLNAAVNARFDNLEVELLDNNTGALASLAIKLEQEMSQVWRQIGIMYSELTVSTSALDKLQEQTKLYVNGSVTTLDNMKGKVGQITDRMSEVDSNLNYLLGRLSLVTQEFNRIKLGLGEALDNIKSSFQTVQDKIKDAGPGPHNIKPEPEEE